MKPSFAFDLTVATVCRNARACLPRCIESVQPLYRMNLRVEHLLVDGCSDDGTVAYLHEQLAAGRISRFISEPDAGLYDAMNKAIRLAKGQIIVFINADDEICPESVELCCEPILSGRAEYTVARALYVSDRTEKIMSPRMDAVLWSQPYCHQSMYCSVDLLARVGGFRGDMFRIAADTDLMRRLYALQVPCECVDSVASRFYEGGVSSSASVYREVYKLTLHHVDLYCKEVQKKPECLVDVLSHFCRVSSRALVHREPGIKVCAADTDVEKMQEFLRKVRCAASPVTLVCNRRYYFFKSISYALVGLVRGGRKREMSKQLAFICRLVYLCLR